jgi:hypothetical protein
MHGLLRARLSLGPRRGTRAMRIGRPDGVEEDEDCGEHLASFPQRLRLLVDVSELAAAAELLGAAWQGAQTGDQAKPVATLRAGGCG